MDQNLREHYQWLQVLVYSLQLPEWPLEKEIKRDYAFGLVVNFAPGLGVTLDPKDPNFLSTVAQKIDQILAEQEEITAIPENLKELVRDYEEYLEAIRDRSLKATFPSLDEQIKALYEKYQQSIQEELVELEKEITPDLKIIKEPNQRLFEEISHRIAVKLIRTLPQTARKEGPSALGEKEYQEILNSSQPLFVQELERAGFSKPKIKTSKAFVERIAAKTLPEAKVLSFVPHKSTPIKTTPVSQLPTEPTPSKPPSKTPFTDKQIKTEPKAPVTKEKTIIEPTIETTIALPQLASLPILKWQPSETKVSPLRKSWALTKKVTLFPLAKPLQWLIHLAPEEIRKENLTLVYAASGVTPETTDQTLKHLYQKKPDSPEIPFWQNLKAAFKTKKPPFSDLWENYYEWSRLGKVKTKIEALKTNRLVKIFTLGQFDNLPNLKTSFWRAFKKTRLGKGISSAAGKLIARLTARLKTTKIVKAGVKQVAIKKGIKATATKVFVWLGKKLGLNLIPVAGQILSVLSLAWDGVKLIGKGIKGLFGKIGKFFTEFLPIKAKQSAQKTLDITENLVIKTATLVGVLLSGLTTISLPASLPLIGVGGTILAVGSIALISSQITSSAFIIPWEGGREYGSRFIQVEKTASYPKAPNRDLDNSDLPFTISYQITIIAKESDLDNIRISDSISLHQKSGEGEIERQDWTIDHLDQGESWSSPEYNLEATTNFEDALLSNQAVVKAIAVSSDEEEESQVSITLAIGTPPIPPNAFLAIQIVNVLNSCNGLAPVNLGVRINRASWSIARECLVNEGLGQAYIIDTFERSIDRWDDLQCVALAVGASQGRLPYPGGSGNADGYCTDDTPGYTLSDDWDNLRPGDYVANSRSDFGHIAIVIIKSGSVVRLAETMGDTGAVQFRPIGLEQLRSFYCGYLRRN